MDFGPPFHSFLVCAAASNLLRRKLFWGHSRRNDAVCQNCGHLDQPMGDETTTAASEKRRGPAELEKAFSAAVKASLTLSPSDRPAFISKHLLAQADGAEPPLAQDGHFNKETLTTELEELSRLLSSVVNVARKSPDWPIRAVAMELARHAGPSSAHSHEHGHALLPQHSEVAATTHRTITARRHQGRRCPRALALAPHEHSPSGARNVPTARPPPPLMCNQSRAGARQVCAGACRVVRRHPPAMRGARRGRSPLPPRPTAGACRRDAPRSPALDRCLCLQDAVRASCARRK